MRPGQTGSPTPRAARRPPRSPRRARCSPRPWAAEARRCRRPESKRILACYGIAIPHGNCRARSRTGRPGGRPDRRPGSDQDRVAGYPAQDRSRRCQAGAIDAGICSQGGADILASAARYAPQARIDGISVQQMAPAGVEIVLGVKNDRQFGPLIAVGLGGIMVELLDDTAVRLAPVDERIARAMLASLRGRALLTGFRGKARRGYRRTGRYHLPAVRACARFEGYDRSDRHQPGRLSVRNGVMAADALIIGR